MTDQPTSEDNTDPELELLKTRLNNAINSCNGYANILITRYGAQVRDDAGKLDYFVLFLKNQGFLSEKQFYEFEVAYMEMVQKQLNETVAEMEAKSKAAGLVKPQRGAKLVDMAGKPLI